MVTAQQGDSEWCTPFVVCRFDLCAKLDQEFQHAVIGLLGNWLMEESGSREAIVGVATVAFLALWGLTSSCSIGED